MLRQFHYIDQNGKDQGINVRNRSKELAELLSDVERIRSERKKARANRNKFGGVEGGGGGLSSGSRYGGFGSEQPGGGAGTDYGGYSGGVYGDGGGFGGNESGFQDTQNRRDRFEEYDEGDDGGAPAATSARRKAGASSSAAAKKPEPAKPKEPEIDILGFDDDIPPETPPKEFNPVSPISNGKRPAGNGLGDEFGGLQSAGAADDDDFDDFQSATPTLSTTTTTSIPNLPPPMAATATQFAAPAPVAPGQSANFAGFNTVSPAPSSSGISSPRAPNYNINMSAPTSTFSPPSVQQQRQTPQTQTQQPTNYQPKGPNYFTSVPAPQATPSATASNTASGRPTPTSTPSFSKPAAKPSAGGGDAFGSLWNTASAGAGIKKTETKGQGPNLASLQREKASQGIWGMGAAPAQQQQQQPPQMGMPMGGAMGGAQSNGSQKTGGAMDDLLG